MSKAYFKTAFLCGALITGLSICGSVRAATAIESLLDKYRGYSTFSSVSDPEQYGVNITTWQMPHGGFSKSMDSNYTKAWDSTTARSAWSSDGVELGMFDNNATVIEIQFLASLYKTTTNSTNKTLFKSSVNKAVAFILKSQYSSGGWPQVYPERTGTTYSNYVTYNDNAMVRVMVVIKDIIDKKAPFDSDIITSANLTALDAALVKGVNFTIKAQIVNSGTLTVWCAQHDPVDYSPKPARAYELESKSGSESVGIVAFLMNWPDQALVKNAATAALNWFKAREVKDTAYSNGTFYYASGKSMWYRFYNVEDDRPFFCGRDGVKKYDIMEIEEERRTGYSWAGTYGTSLMSAMPLYLSTGVSKQQTKKYATESEICLEKNMLVLNTSFSGNISISLYNALGEVCFEHTVQSMDGAARISFADTGLSPGAYIAAVKKDGIVMHSSRINLTY